MNERTEIVVVGENNPYGDDPHYALYPLPEHSAGGRLCRLILGMETRDYLRELKRVNLLQAPKWSAPRAREAAAALISGHAPARFILLGKRVFSAFAPHFSPKETTWEPFRIYGRCLTLPHPSGLCRLWNEPGSISRTRIAVKEFAPEIGPYVGARRPQ